jgi:hypothetical protein
MQNNISITTTSGAREIPAAWVGSHLAVHRPVLTDGEKAEPRQWCITHLASGLSMGGTLSTTKPEALTLARLWDAAAGEIDPGNPHGWRYVQTWLLDVAVIEHRRIAELAGPVLPDCPTAGDVAAAISAAIGGDYQPVSEDDGAEQYPARETVAASLLRDGTYGLEMFWRGEWWQVPTMGEVEAWALFEGAAETPDGRTVEPDAPDAWPVLLGVI